MEQLKKIPFFEVFSAYIPGDPQLGTQLLTCRVTQMVTDREAGTISATLEAAEPLSDTQLMTLAEELSQLYGARVHLNTLDAGSQAVLPDWSDAPQDPEKLMELLSREICKQFLPARGLLAGATGSLQGHTLTVTLPNGGRDLLENYIAGAAKALPKRDGQQIIVRLLNKEPGQVKRTSHLLETAEDERLAAIKVRRSGKAEKEVKPGRPGTVMFGKVSMKSITPMSELNLNMGTVLVEGDVFSIAHRDLRNRSDKVIRFDVTDHTSSVRVSQFMHEEEYKPILKNLKLGQRLLIQGKLTMDRFDNDMVLQPTGIMYGERISRKDTAKEKRVELHLHTCMSALDALTDTKKVVARAAAWGHRAIAITDHGVAHSFPDAHGAAGKAGGKIKVLYGVEAYYRNDVDSTVAIHNAGDLPLDGEYVVFDIETTGLDHRRDAIIEIGAVLVRDGAVQPERFSTFVDPRRPLSPRIISLTGITDEMLAGAPSQDDAVRDFLAFCAGRPLVAHNADFDISFIRTAANRIGVPFRPTTVDTLTLGRRLYPELHNHKLDTLATFLGLVEFNHHRADDDAVTCAGILLDELRRLRERGLSKLSEVDPALAGQKLVGKSHRHANHLIILAKNQTGLRNLYKLISLSHLEHFHFSPTMPKSLINENREGLIIGSACEAGELFRAVVDGKSEEELERIAQWYDYLEIQPISNNSYMLRPGKDGRQIAQSEEDLRDFNRTIVRLGETLGKPVCATCDVHFMDPEDEIFRHILLDSKGIDDADSPNPLYFRTTDEMLEEFSYLGEEKAYEVVVKNTNLIADQCDTLSPLPKGLFPPKIENSAQLLSDLVWNKAHALYGEEPPQIVVDRINAELGDILRCHYDVIYMSAQKLVQDSLDHGYLVGSRGSVGSSIVAFMSGITEVNSLPAHYRCPNCKHADFEFGEANGYGCGADMPDAVCPVCGTPYEKDGFNIPFETFLGFGGDKVPDIDLNFSGEYQSSAHRHTFELFGENHVFRAGTIGTLKEKNAFGFVKKYLDKRKLTVSKAEENRLTAGCTGVKRTTGQHPGGMVVIPQDKEIYDFCPVQHPADAKDSDIITTHFEYHSMESNLLKLDMLGHDDPSMIRMLQDLTGVDPQKIPLDDPDTMSLFTSSKALGFENDKVLGPTGAVAVPEFNTRFTRGVLEETQPTQFDTLLRISGFTHGTDVWLGNARDLIVNEVTDARGCVGCRDDIMLYLISKGIDAKLAFKIMEAVRKGKVKKNGFQEGWVETMKEHGVPDWYIGSLAKIAYLFPKAHAVAYVMMAFRIAWFKVHRPLAFYAAFFTIRAKAFDATVMCQGMEMVKRKMQEISDKEVPTDVEQNMLVTLEVCYEFYLRGYHFEAINLYRSEAVNFLLDEEKGCLLPPFTSVPGLGEAAAQSIVEQRVGREFVSITELSAACPKVSKAHIEGLKAAGALAGLPESSQLTFFDFEGSQDGGENDG